MSDCVLIVFTLRVIITSGPPLISIKTSKPLAKITNTHGNPAAPRTRCLRFDFVRTAKVLRRKSVLKSFSRRFLLIFTRNPRDMNSPLINTRTSVKHLNQDFNYFRSLACTRLTHFIFTRKNTVIISTQDYTTVPVFERFFRTRFIYFFFFLVTRRTLNVDLSAMM